MWVLAAKVAGAGGLASILGAVEISKNLEGGSWNLEGGSWNLEGGVVESRRRLRGLQGANFGCTGVQSNSARPPSDFDCTGVQSKCAQAQSGCTVAQSDCA